MSARAADLATYRRMMQADLATVCAIESTVHAHPWTPGNFQDSFDAGYECWVAESRSEIAGYSVMLVAAGEAHLLNLSIAAAWQRRGIGRDFTRFVVKLARDHGATKIYLEVRPSNAAALALYSGEGFGEVGVRHDYYPAVGGREDAVIMEREL